jgi:hypothetical protein
MINEFLEFYGKIHDKWVPRVFYGRINDQWVPCVFLGW